MTALEKYYEHQASRLATEIAGLKQRSRRFIAGEITAFLLFIGFLVLYTVVDWGTVLIVFSLLSLVLYSAIRRLDVLNDEHIHDLSALRNVYLHEWSYHQADFSCFDSGARYADPHHPFTFDLDVFGRDSLFQRINRTVTTGGSDQLAARLATVADTSSCADAIDELAEMETWRARFMAFEYDRKIDSTAILHALQAVKMLKIPAFAGSRLVFAAAWLLVGGLFVAIAGAVAGVVSANLPIAWAVLQFFAVFFVCSGPCRVIAKAVDQLHAQFRTYAALIRWVGQTTFRTPENRSLAQLLNQSITSFDQLNDLLNALDRRANVLGLFLMDALFLSDFFLVRRFLRWQSRYTDRIPEWIEAVGRIDALVSMGTFRYNEPQAVRAEVVRSASVIYEARGLYHPFLGTEAVPNDITLADRHYYIVTGANMAGKSTFLRAIGVNYLLAMNGLPVFAQSLRVSAFGLFSSMRTTDDLAHGISYFNAELLRLKQLIEYSKNNSPTLIILDEILKGTNSLDKLNGSRLFLQSMAALPVTGIIATHDLELSKIENERFHNYCFEIELGNHVTYSYRLTPGVARNQNATFLLKELLCQA